MRYLLKLFIVLIVTLNLNANDSVSKFGFLSYNNNTLNFKDARDSLSSWIEDLGVSNNLKVDVTFYNTIDELVTAYKNNELDMIVLSFPDFYKNENTLRPISKDFWSASGTNEIYTQFYLVSLKELNVNSFKDIENKSLSIEEHEPISKVWLDKNSLIANKKSSEKMLKKIFFETKEQTPLLNVFFKKSDLAIVTKDTWNTMIQLNPSIEKKIKIIERSEKNYLNIIGLFSKNTKQEKIDVFFKITSKIEDATRGKELLSLLKFNNYFRLENSYIDNMEKYYDDYFDLKEKFN